MGKAVLWFVVLGLAVWAADWGADKVALPFQKLKARWGLTGAAGGALLALVSTTIENVPLYSLNLGFVFLFGVIFAVVTALANRQGGMTKRHVSFIGGVYVLYLVCVVSFLMLTGQKASHSGAS